MSVSSVSHKLSDFVHLTVFANSDRTEIARVRLEQVQTLMIMSWPRCVRSWSSHDDSWKAAVRKTGRWGHGWWNGGGWTQHEQGDVWRCLAGAGQGGKMNFGRRDVATRIGRTVGITLNVSLKPSYELTGSQLGCMEQDGDEDSKEGRREQEGGTA